jgi:2,3-bisphosphoglycerate-independent phosphoglycerate mutase
MPGGAMGQGQDTPEQRQMMEQHQKMLDLRREMQEQAEALENQLKEKMEALNKANGDARLDAVVDVLNTMYQQRIQAQQNMKKLQESMGMMSGGGMGSAMGMGGGGGLGVEQAEVVERHLNAVVAEVGHLLDDVNLVLCERGGVEEQVQSESRFQGLSS